MALATNHFTLFGLPQSFVIDTGALDVRYRAVQAEVHPDRFASNSEGERRRAVQLSAQVNEAYQTLRAPLARARYLLGLHGVDTAVESNTAMPTDFLMAQMEWREQFEEARAARDIEALEGLLDSLREQLDAGYRSLSASLDSRGDLAAAANTVRELMFVERLREQVSDVLGELE